jgi:hypothetical protein
MVEINPETRELLRVGGVGGVRVSPIRTEVVPRVPRQKEELRAFLMRQMGSAKKGLEKDGGLRAKYYVFGRERDLLVHGFSEHVRNREEEMAVLEQFAKMQEADAVAVIADSYVGKRDSRGPLKDLPPSERGEALVTFLRTRDCNQMWGCALPYERRGGDINWLQEVTGEVNVNDMDMIPRWY